jgi:hypothetical protein
MLEHASELSHHEEWPSPRRARAAGRRPSPSDRVVVLNVGAVVRVRLDRKGTSAGAGECRLLCRFLDAGTNETLSTLS